MTLHGTVLGKYQILARLGEGGMGTVYHARDEMLDRDVAIKVLRPELARQSSLVERFRSEAIALARLAHPNIAALHGLERDGGQLLMIMEYVQGETLESRIHRTGGLPWRRAVEICADVCGALDHAHDSGVVHRDIKPANLMVTPRGTIKVMDFGIARVIGRNRQTQSGRSVGTPMYMAPEQLRGEEVDGRTDIYALGAVLYELITGQLAFDADSDYSLMLKQLNEAPPSPSFRVSGVPSVVDGIVSRAMAKGAADRFASAAAMRSELFRALADTPAEATAAADWGAMPATRLSLEAGPPPPAYASSNAIPSTGELRLEPAPTRVVDDRSEVGATRLASDSPSLSATRWHLDWRIWSAAAVLLVAAALSIRYVNQNTPDEALLQASATTSPSTTGAAAQTTRQDAQPILQGSGSSSIATPPVASLDPRLAGARPLVVGDETPATRNTPKGTEKPRAAPPPPTNVRKRDTVVTPPPEPRPALPPPREAESTPRNTPEPEVKPKAVESAEAAQSAIRTAIGSWLAAIGASDAGTIAATMDNASKSHTELLELVRGRRASVVGQDSPAIELSGTSATATVSTAVSYRSPFGATRRSDVQFALALARDGSVWRVTKARIVGSPRLN